METHALHVQREHTKLRVEVRHARHARTTPALRAAVAPHWLVALATLDFTARMEVLAQRVRPVQLHPSEVRRVLRVLSLIATPDTPARAAVHVSLVLPERTKSRPVPPRARTVDPARTRQQQELLLRRLVLRVRPTPALLAQYVVHRPAVPATSGTQDPTAASARHALPEPTKTQPALRHAQDARPTPALLAADAIHQRVLVTLVTPAET